MMIASGCGWRIAMALGGAALCTTLSSCMVGPNYQRPSLEVPGQFKQAAATQPATTQAATTQPAVAHLGTDWWRLFNDAELNSLEEQAVAANQGLKAAMARVVQARAAAGITRSGFFPVITLDPSATRSRSSGNRSAGTAGGTGRTSTDVRVPFDLTYEIDVWGRVRRSYESSLAQVQASADDYQVVLQTLEADVAQNYFSLRAFDSQAQILAKSVESFRVQLDLTQTKFKAGLVGQIDVMQAETQLNSTMVQEAEARRQRADLEHAIAILLGRPPSELTIAVRPLELAPPIVPPGMPAELLRRRPDIAEAEQNLISANAQVGVAIAQFYPKVSLTGAAGFESADFQHVFDWQSRLWSLGPSISTPIFEGGKLKAGVQQAKARYDELVADYRGQVLTAFREVEDSLTDLHLRSEEAKLQDVAVRSASEYLRLSQIQYERGLANYLLVLDAQRTLLTNELSAVQILNQRLISTVLLIKAVGGGWDVQMPAVGTAEQQ